MPRVLAANNGLPALLATPCHALLARTAVAATLCSSSLSQWGAIRALTAALCRDLDAALCARGAALAGLELERAAARQALADAEQASRRTWRGRCSLTNSTVYSSVSTLSVQCTL